MRRFTTPTITIHITGLDLTDYHTETTIKQGSTVIVRENLPVTVTDTGCDLVAVLTQEETGQLRAAGAQIQVRFIDSEGVASASNIKWIPIGDVLKDGVIEYE